MLTHRPSAARGGGDYDWLQTRHTFSFSNYYDPDWMGFRSLRVINEDHIAPGRGFPMHPHRDMEILTYVVSGALEHKDSIGSGSVLRRGELQRMSAGSGIEHSEFNHSGSEPVHLLQIWLHPQRRGIRPGYEQRAFEFDQQPDKLVLVASPDGRDGSLTIHQDASVYAARLAAGVEVEHQLEKGRGAWLQLISGSLDVSGQALEAGDGLMVEDTPAIAIAARSDSELLLFDLGPQ